MAEDDKAQYERARSLVQAGAEMVAGAASGALGMLAAGPVGAVGAGAGGVALTRLCVRVASEISNRFLGPREQVRIGAAAAVAMDSIRERLSSGEQLREENFWQSGENTSSAAEQLFEGVLSASRAAHEEKKAPYFGHFYANVVFDDEVSPEEANQLLSLADRLTYRQFCLLALFDTKPEGLRTRDYRPEGPHQSWWASRDTLYVLQEVYTLYQLALIRRQDLKGKSEEWDEADRVLTSVYDVVPAYMHVAVLGGHFVPLFGLEALPEKDLVAVAAFLQDRPKPGSSNPELEL